MPVTRRRERLMESQEDDVEDSRLLQMTHETDEEHEAQSTDAVDDAQDAVNLEAMAQQLTNTLEHLLTTHRQLETDAAMIQAGMDELHRMQEDRAQRMVDRLKNASSTILTFGEGPQDARGQRPEQDERDCEEDDEMMQ